MNVKLAHYVKNLRIRSFFQGRIFPHSLEYVDLICKSQYSTQKLENKDWKKRRIWTLFNKF